VGSALEMGQIKRIKTDGHEIMLSFSFKGKGPALDLG